MDKLDEFLNELGSLSRQPRATVDRGRLNKVKELIGEVGGHDEIFRKFGADRLRMLSPPRRAGGVIILDFLFELDDGQFVIVEAKYGESQAGRSKFKRASIVSVSQGKVMQAPLPLKEQLEQLDAMWIRERIDEIEKHDEPLGKALRKAFAEEKVQVFEARTRVELTPGQRRALTTQLTDHTQTIRTQAKVGRRFIDHEHRFAIREALSEQQLKALAAKTKQLEKSLKDARKAQQPVQTELSKAKRNLARLRQTPGKQLTSAQVAARARWTQAIADLEKELEPLKQAVTDAEEALAAHKETIKVAEEVRDYSARARKAEEKFKRLQMEKQLKAGRASGKFTEEEKRLLDRRLEDKPAGKPGGGGDPGPRPSSNVKGTAPPQKATDKPLTEGKGLVQKSEKSATEAAKAAAKSKPVARAGGGAAQVAAKGGRLSRMALKGTKVVARAGSLVFKVVNFADPLFLLMDVVAVIDALVAWIRRDKIEDEKEWKRIANFLFGPRELITNRFGVVYPTTMGNQIEAHVPLRMADAQNGTGNIFYWIGRWQSDVNWPGFVYIQIDAELERQQCDDDDVAYPVRYFWDKLPQIRFTDRPQPNVRTETERLTWLGSGDPRNRFTEGRGGGGGPETNISAQPSFITVRYTYPQPYLTPFDFILIKCQTLLADLASFIAQFDEDFLIGLEAEDSEFTSIRQDTIRAYPFRKPFVAFELHVCLIHIDFYIKLLSSHATLQDDHKRQNIFDPYNAGRNRRLRLLQKLASPNGLSYPDKYRDPKFSNYRQMRPFWEIVLRLGKIITSEDPAVLADLKHLRDLASTIDDDAKRALALAQKEATGFLFNYEGSTKKPGS
ncbi:hypothetical protein [Sinorhizobium meliloti]|uniref:hypothetical protein n=1 Tax=Rhizobium meliloti TaxID=382 RepID=UPI002090F2C0|nr:hypothetical protein [Sinorhizobium meliloti]MCO5963689.1 hypothetical protein [Sinorhizobium meliloti]